MFKTRREFILAASKMQRMLADKQRLVVITGKVSK